MPYVKINAEECKQCLLCVNFCPRGVLGLSKGINSRGFHHADVINPERCTGCRICALMCPDVCIQVFREKKDGGEK